jgi:deoxyribonuclease-1-like protein
MPKLWFVGLLTVAVVGGWYFLTHYEIGGVDSLSVAPRTDQESEPSKTVAEEQEQLPVPKGRKTIRIATVNLGPFDQHKMNKQHVVDRLVEVIRQFDIVAVQDVRARDQGILLQFVEQINADGQHYDFATPPNVGRDLVEQYSAFLFDRATVQIDRGTVYPVKDPAERFRREPLVASFQTRGPDAAETFTFTLINVHIDPSHADELDLLDDVFRAVRDDGRGEDDVILLGDLGTDDQHLGQLREVPNVTWALSGVPSTTRGTRLVDNVLFDRRATAEFTGRSGVVDLIRQFDLSMRQAVEISDHLPVWVECSVYEGGQAGHVASEQSATTQ